MFRSSFVINVIAMQYMGKIDIYIASSCAVISYSKWVCFVVYLRKDETKNKHDSINDNFDPKVQSQQNKKQFLNSSSSADFTLRVSTNKSSMIFLCAASDGVLVLLNNKSLHTHYIYLVLILLNLQNRHHTST